MTGPSSFVGRGASSTSQGALRAAASLDARTWAQVVAWVAVLATFSALAPGFLAWSTVHNIAVQSASLGILVVGMTFVLLVGGIDLSVGAVMLVAGVCAGKASLAGWPVVVSLLVGLAAAAAWGGLHASLVAWLRLPAFIVTLATLNMARGSALFVSETRAMPLPAEATSWASGALLGVPVPVVCLLGCLFAGHALLTRTSLGCEIRAVGHDVEGARRAGLQVRRIVATTYVISAVCAGLAGIVVVAQVGVVSPSLGLQRELAAIAAAVLGGTSLFGGRGSVLRGVVGALFMQTIETGLVMADTDPYAYPIFTAAVIFLAAALDRYGHSRAASRRGPKILVPLRRS